MALLQRLSHAEGFDPLPVHYFWAAMVEMALGEVTVSQVKAHFNLIGDDANELDWLVGRYQATANKERFLEVLHVIFMLGESRAPGYTDVVDLAARINRI